jgi:hypothetical protein
LVLIRLILALLLASSAFAPAAAHKDHQKKMAEAAAAAKAQEEASRLPAGEVVAHPMSPAVHEAIKEDVAKLEAEAALPVHQRLLDWLGRIHPFAVHFPLALFPVSWLALILTRRRGGATDVIRALIIVAGASAGGAALLGWLNAGLVMFDKDPLLLWHRWLGTAIALVGSILAVWAWRRPSAADSRLMVPLLATLTFALLVQGWFGGALIHGIDHLNW